LALVAVGASSTLQRVNDAIFAVSITASVAFLLAIKGLPEPAVAVHRAIATLLGGALALLAHVRFFRPRSTEAAKQAVPFGLLGVFVRWW
jgi:uncharacterized membrane protein YccC